MFPTESENNSIDIKGCKIVLKKPRGGKNIMRRDATSGYPDEMK